jgi:hypothetical protein
MARARYGGVTKRYEQELLVENGDPVERRQT